MKCEAAQDHIILAYYGELPDELAGSLEQHIADCEECRTEMSAMHSLDERMALLPVAEPSPNFVAQSRMRLDEALDMVPPHGMFTRLQSNFFAWVGHLRSAPALATLLVGVGFLGGNFLNRYEVARQPKAPAGPVVISTPTQGVVSNVTGIEQIPNTELVQVHYNRIVPETVEGSLDAPDIRNLILKGTTAATDDRVRAHSVGLIASECKAGHSCTSGEDGKGIRSALLVSLRYDKDPGVRLKALEGLQPYVGEDNRVRDAVLEALARDPNAQVRAAAIDLLEPVQQDSSVRQVLRTASTQDENPSIRTASYNALQGSDSIQ